MYHEHLKRKDEIRTKIERLTREKNFLEQLNPSEVLHMFQKKNEITINNQRLAEQELISPEKIKERMGSPSPKKRSEVSPHKDRLGGETIMQRTFSLRKITTIDEEEREEERLNKKILLVNVPSMSDQEQIKYKQDLEKLN